MSDTGKNSEGRPWWESRMDWSLPGSLEITLRMSRDLLRNIPQAVSAHKIGKTSPLDELEPDPIEKMVVEKTTTETHIVEKPQTTHAKAPYVVPPPPPSPAKAVRAINMPSAVSNPVQKAATSPDIAVDPLTVIADADKPTVPMVKPVAAPSAADKSTVPMRKPLPVVQAPCADRGKRIDIDDQLDQEVSKRKITLEQLLDPDFDDY